MRIKTRESLRSIKTFDRAETLASKIKGGISELHRGAEKTQGCGYESGTAYAGNQVQGAEEKGTRNTIYGANQVGKWGVRETRRNIYHWRNRKKKVPLPKSKALPSPERQLLSAPKTAEKTAKTAQKTAKATVKASPRRVAQVAKAAAKATVHGIKVAVKATVAAVKAIVAAVKGIIAAIAAGGWIAVLIIVILVLVGLIVGSVYAIFIPAGKNGITVSDVKSNLEREYLERQEELIANCRYDVLRYEGGIAAWNEMIAVYAARLNLDWNNPREVATFDAPKAEELKAIFWDMNALSLRTETKTEVVTKYKTDAHGKTVEVKEEVTTVILTVVTESLCADEISVRYGFSARQNEMLDELLRIENTELWAGLLGG